MPTYVEIAVNVPSVTEVFDYHLPEELEGHVRVGHLVQVPFGKQAVQGVVLRFIAQPSVEQTREVTALVDQEAVLTGVQLALAQQLSQTTLFPLAAWIQLMLPPGLGQQADLLYQINDQWSATKARQLKELSKLQVRLVNLLEERGALRGRQIDQAMPRLDWRPSARRLIQKNILAAKPVLPAPTVKPKRVRTAELACPAEAVEGALATLGRAGSAAVERRKKILHYLVQESGAVDVPWVYAASGGKPSDLHKLAQLGLVQLGDSQAWRDPLGGKSFQPTQPPPLTRDQQACWEQIRENLQKAAGGVEVPPVLLHGVTGSGKTEIYMHAVEETLRLGRQAIILVPEIALTPQTVGRFLSRFAGRVGLVHSQLSSGERYDTWRRAWSGDLAVVVGPRSALFTPFPDPGLIVVDECHDDTYYQDEPPFYHARRVAILYAGLVKGVCLLGSATPEISDYYQTERGHWIYLHLPERILAHRQAVQAQVERLGLASQYRPLEGQAETIELPRVSVVDMRKELKEGNRSIFSRQMQTRLAEVLEHNQQAILFLNRRGMATYVFCRDCGYALRCPRCDLPLTYHLQGQGEALPDRHRDVLCCHHCGYQRGLPKTCPQCGGERIRHYGTGTEKVEDEVQALFPEVRTLRWDFETTRQKGAHERILDNFTSHHADVLVGTQMLAKGLDLPLVTLVGVVLADVGLNLPDYRAAERTFQVLTQVAGRAGRSPLGGDVILQTFQPEHYVIQAAARHDYQAFYRQEVEYRRQLGYPPFQQLLRMEYRHLRAAEAESAAEKMTGRIRGWIEENHSPLEIIGPVPCFFAREAGMSRWQIILRGSNPASLLRGRKLGDWRLEVDPPSLL